MAQDLNPAERITIIEEWHGDTRTRYTLTLDGRKELMDIETISPRPFMLMPRASIKTTIGAENAIQWLQN